MAQQSWASDKDSGGGATLDGFRTVTDISKKVVQSAQPMMKFRQFVNVEPAYGKNKGESVQIYRAGNTATAYDTSAINELDRIPTTSVSVTPKLITINEWGRAIPFTGKVETLAEVDVESDVYLKALRNHMAKTLDYQVAQAFLGTDLLYIPTSASAGTWDVDGTASTAATADLTAFHIKEIVDAMKTGVFGSGNTGNPVPFYADNYYICIASVSALRALHDDPDFESISDYANAEGFYRGEIGRMPFYNVRFVESNHTNALPNSLNTSYSGEAVFFGEDPVREIVAIPEEIREKIPDDYGRNKGVAWYAMLGWGRVWDFSTDGEEHIVRVTSS